MCISLGGDVVKKVGLDDFIARLRTVRDDVDKSKDEGGSGIRGWESLPKCILQRRAGELFWLVFLALLLSGEGRKQRKTWKCACSAPCTEIISLGHVCALAGHHARPRLHEGHSNLQRTGLGPQWHLSSKGRGHIEMTPAYHAHGLACPRRFSLAK